MLKSFMLLMTGLVGFSATLRAQLCVKNSVLYIPSGSFVAVQPDLISNVDIQGAGRLVLNGKSGQLVDMGGHKLHDLDIADTMGVKLGSGMASDGTIQFIKGIFNLESYVLDLGSGGGTLNGETNASRIFSTTGTVNKTAVFNAPDLFNPGNLGLILTSTANMGTLTVKRGHQQQTSANGGLSIDRYYDISPPASNSGLNATLNFAYFDGELAGRIRSELNLWTSSDGGTSWGDLGADLRDTVKDDVIKNGVAHFSRFTLASGVNNPLPLTLLGFSGIRSGGVDRLTWQTAEEFQVRSFEVEYGTDSSGFSVAGVVSAIGSGSNVYSFFHPASGQAYYRLKMVDLDGRFTYSKVIALSDGFISPASRLQPNPAYSGTQLVLGDKRLLGTQAQLFDGGGRLVGVVLITSLQQDIDLGGLTPGVYYIKLQSGETLTLVKK